MRFQPLTQSPPLQYLFRHPPSSQPLTVVQKEDVFSYEFFNPDEERFMDKELNVERPWWSISKLAQKICLAATLTMTASLILAIAASAIIPAAIANTAILISTVGLSVLFGVFVLERIRQQSMLPLKLQRIADAIHAHILEVFSLAAAATLYPTALFQKNPKGAAPPGSTPILLVHGYLHNSSAWVYTKARLKSAGLGPVYTINLDKTPLTLKSITEYARVVQDKVDSIVAETDCSEVIVVGHSMGGVVGAEAATTLDGNHKIGQLITLGSPLQGTRLGYLGFGKCAEEMRYSKDNPFLARLVDRLSQTPKKVHHVYSRSDLVVIPNESAALGGKDKTLFADHGHLSYLWSDKVIDRLIVLIRTHIRRPTR